MTGLSAFEPGSGLQCAGCEFQLDLNPGCLIATEMADDGEVMSPACCPQPHLEDAPCPVCGGPLPCPVCLAALRCDAA